MTRRASLSVALGSLAGIALVGLYLVVVTVAQGADHAVALLWDGRLFVTLISVGFGTQIGLFSYVRLLQRDLARGSVAVTGAATATASLSMLACCVHHVTDVLPIVGLSGFALFLVEFRTPLIFVGLATNAVGIVVMVRQLERITARVRVVSRRGMMPA